MTTGRKDRSARPPGKPLGKLLGKPPGRTRSKAAATGLQGHQTAQSAPADAQIVAPSASVADTESRMTPFEEVPAADTPVAEPAPVAEMPSLAETTSLAETPPAPEAEAATAPLAPEAVAAAPEPAAEDEAADLPVIEAAAPGVGAEEEPFAEEPAAEEPAAEEPVAAVSAALAETAAEAAEAIAEPGPKAEPEAAEPAGFAAFEAVNARVLVFVRGELTATFAFWNALREAQNPGEAVRLQIDEASRSFASMLAFWNDLAQYAVRSVLDRRAA